MCGRYIFYCYLWCAFPAFSLQIFFDAPLNYSMSSLKVSVMVMLKNCAHDQVQGVMLLRAYAFSGRRTWCLISLLICFIAVCGSSTWALYDGKNLPDFYYQFLGKAGCFPYYGGGEMSLKLGVRPSFSVTLRYSVLISGARQ